MNDITTTTRKQFLVLLAIMAALFVIFCLALYQYDQSHNVGTQAYQRLQKQNSTTQATNTSLTAQNKALQANSDALTVKNTEQANEKSQLCLDVGKAKITEPLCTQ